MVHQQLLYLQIQLMDLDRAVLRRAKHGAIELHRTPLEEEMEPVKIFVKLYVQVVEGIPVSRAQWKSLLKSCLAKHHLCQRCPGFRRRQSATMAWTSTQTRRRPRT